MKHILYLIALYSSVLIGCAPNSDKSKVEAGTASSLEPLVYTLYSEKSELFVEFKPLVVGTASSFAAHFTALGENFTPLTEGEITLSLIIGEKGLRQVASAPSSPGIFRLSLTPAVSGTGKLVFDIKTKDYTDQIIIENVVVYPDENTALANVVAKEASANEITYLKEQAWNVGFATTPIEKQAFSNIIKSSGQIISAPGDEMIIAAKARGIVLFSGNKTIVGSEVGTGNRLFIISGSDIAEGNIDVNFKEAKANYEKASADYDRAKKLIADKIISEKDFLQTQLVFQNAQTIFNSLSRNYSSSGQGISSPMNGFIKNVLVSEGQFVEAGTPLATVSKNRKLVLRVNVSQKYFNDLSTISSANFKTADQGKVYSTADLNGSVVSFGKSTSSGSPFIPLSFEIDNVDQLIPGSVVEVYLKSYLIPDALVIPESSLLEEQGNFFVYVQTEGESFQKREVKLGASDGLNVQILSGVVDGERVVSKGAYQIKLSTASGTLPDHGHEH